MALRCSGRPIAGGMSDDAGATVSGLDRREWTQARDRKDGPMTALEEKLVEYIDDAYAMEQNVKRMLDSMIGTTKDPQLKRALERHRKQTEQQAERLEECLREHGASPSTAKEVGGVMAALMKSALESATVESAVA